MSSASPPALSIGARAQADWPALAAARWHARPRLVLLLHAPSSAASPQAIGSVGAEHLPALHRWPQWLHLSPDAVRLTLPDEATARDAALAEIHQQLRADGLIKAWRDETFGLLDPAGGHVLARMERAACRFWGSLTRGAHLNGYVADANGRPTHLWIARRSWQKATDPGRLDNLVGGGVPVDQTPHETLVREAWEEAGLPADLARQAVPGGVIRIDCDVPEGRMVEDIHGHDLRLPEHVIPQNQDGEVAELHRMPVADALRCAADGQMTTDAALVTLDFALRHGLLPEADVQPLQTRFASLLHPAV